MKIADDSEYLPIYFSAVFFSKVQIINRTISGSAGAPFPCVKPIWSMVKYVQMDSFFFLLLCHHVYSVQSPLFYCHSCVSYTTKTRGEILRHILVAFSVVTRLRLVDTRSRVFRICIIERERVRTDRTQSCWGNVCAGSSNTPWVKGYMIDRAMACQIMQFYFIWFSAKVIAVLAALPGQTPDDGVMYWLLALFLSLLTVHSSSKLSACTISTPTSSFLARQKEK